MGFFEGAFQLWQKKIHTPQDLVSKERVPALVFFSAKNWRTLWEQIGTHFFHVQIRC
jgi:hypothetical protein